MAFRRKLNTESIMIGLAVIILITAAFGGTIATAEFVGQHVAGLSEVVTP